MDFQEKIDQEKLKKTAIFTAKFAFAGLIFRAILFLHPDTYFLESALASLSGNILEMIGTQSEVFGNRIKIGNTIYLVNQDCLGWKSIAAFTGLTWASDFDKKKDAMLIGASVLIVLNIVRIITTIELSVSGIVSFELLHIFLWRWGLTAAVLATWIAYVWRVKK